MTLQNALVHSSCRKKAFKVFKIDSARSDYDEAGNVFLLCCVYR